MYSRCVGYIELEFEAQPLNLWLATKSLMENVMGRCLLTILVLSLIALGGCSDTLTPEERQRIGDGGTGGPAAGGTAGQIGGAGGQAGGAGFNGQGGVGGQGGVAGQMGMGGQAGGMVGNLMENQVSIETSQGTFVIELNFDAAPITARNFLDYVEGGFYDGSDGAGRTTFHFVDPQFSIAGGGFAEDGSLKPVSAPIGLEANNGLNNVRGAVAINRNLQLAASATSQFLVNVVDNPTIDFMDENRAGYVVFARVISGIEVIDAIAAVPVDAEDRPVTPVTINRVQRWR